MDGLFVTHRDELFEYTQVYRRHVLESEVSRLCLDSVLREHLLYQSKDYLHVQDFYHVLDDLLVYEVLHGSGCQTIIQLL